MTPASGGFATPGAFTGALGTPRIAITRQRTSKNRLKMKWRYPIYKPEIGEGETVTVMPDRALEREKVFEELAGDDPRPLLVLRECRLCVGSEVAVLSREKENDRTILLSHYFNCVKLPNDVLREDHPFRNAFGEKDPAHLFLATADGSGYIPLNGAQSQSDLIGSMNEVLRTVYKDNADKRTKERMKLLAEFDHLDSMIDLVEERIDDEIEKRGPKSPKLRKLNKDLAKYEKQRDEAIEKEKKLTDMRLRQPKKSSQPVAHAGR